MRNLKEYLKIKFASQNFELKKFEKSIAPLENCIHYKEENETLLLYPDPRKFCIVKNILIPPGTTNNKIKIDTPNLETFHIYICGTTHFKICK